MTNSSATGNTKRPEFWRHEALHRPGRAPHFICCEGQLKTFNGIVRLSSFSAAGLLTLPLSVTAGVICQMGPLTVSHWLSTLIQPRPMKKPVIKWEVWHNSCLMVEKQQPVRWLKAGPTEHKFYLPADAACKRSAWLSLVFYCRRIKRQKRLIICLRCFLCASLTCRIHQDGAPGVVIEVRRRNSSGESIQLIFGVRRSLSMCSLVLLRSSSHANQPDETINRMH